MMVINPAIPAVLSQFNIPEKEGITYLLSVYFSCIPSYIPPILIQKINISNILGYVNQEIVWNTPLFENLEKPLEDKWNWVVTEYMPMFKAVNSKRVGSKISCLPRMKAYFAQNPEVRKDDILGATKMYIQSVQNPEYLITSHYFILKDKGVHKTSLLEEWLEKYNLLMAESAEKSNTSDLTNQMQ